MTRYDATERVGVSEVQSAIVGELGWLFREQPISDFGIDAHLETVADGNPTGKLIAIQIKSGSAHFHENSKTFTHYVDKTHYEYWVNHSLPVVLVGVPSPGTIIWQKLAMTTITETKRGYKVLVPKAQTLTSDAKAALAAVAEGPAEAQKIRKLLLDRPIVQYLLEGGLVYVEFEDWVNKSLGRSEIKVFFAERENYTWKYWFTGMDVFGLIGKLFPWADYVLDEEYYSLHCEYSGEELELMKRRHGDI